MAWRTFAACIAAASIGCAVPATAAIFTYDFSGTVISGIDESGVFGPAGTDLSSQPFDLAYTFDTGHSTIQENPHVSVEVDGGGAAVFTLNGVTEDLSGFRSFIGGRNTFASFGFFAQASGPLGGADVSIYNLYLRNGVNFPTELGAPYVGPACPHLYNAFFHVCSGSVDLGRTNLSLALTDLTITDDVLHTHLFIPTPEPGTWALMLLGFFALGWALRRRRKAMAN